MTATTVRPIVVRGPVVRRARPRRLRLSASSCPVTGALGLCVIALSFWLNRRGHGGPPATAVFWVGFLVLLGPITARLVSFQTVRRDRLGLVVLFGLLTYGVKVLHDPLTFVMGDEFLHVAVAVKQGIGQPLHRIFADQGINVAAGYPGLELFSVSLARISGLSLFVCGLVTIGVARVVVMVGIFVLAERLTRSSRIAGLAALLFAANSNFLLWSAQFSYESLALPLFVVVLALLADRGSLERPRREAIVPVVVIGAAIVVTHHLTSFALVIVLWFESACALRPRWRRFRSLFLAGVVTAGVVAWLLIVAPETSSYLGYILRRTITGIGQTISGGARQPFSSTSYNSTRWPLAEELLSYLGVLLLALGTLAALWRHRRLRSLRTPLHLLLVGASVAYLGLFVLRLSAGSWETANRGQEFVFVAPAILIAAGIVELLARSRRRRWTSTLIGAAIAVVIGGGVVQGWESRLLLPAPLEVSAQGATLRPQSTVAASWAIAHLGADMTYMADESSARELVSRGANRTFLGSDHDVPEILHNSGLPAWQTDVLRRQAVDFVFVDRRRISTDPQAGFYFPTAADPSQGQGYYTTAALRKFAGLPSASAVFQSGDIAIYDIRGLHAAPPQCRDVGLASALSGITCLRGTRRLTYARARARIELGRSAIRMLGVETLRAGATRVLTVRLQLQNPGRVPLTLPTTAAALHLDVSGHRLERQRSVPYRDDALPATVRIPAGRAVQGSVTFVVAGRATLAALHRAGALLYVAAPGRGRRIGRVAGVFDVGRGSAPERRALRRSPGVDRSRPSRRRRADETVDERAGAPPPPRRRLRSGRPVAARPRAPARAGSRSRR